MGKVVLIEVFLFNIVDCLFDIWDVVSGESGKNTLVPIFLISFSIQVLITGHYYLAKRSLKMVRYFNSIQTIIITIGITEKALSGGDIDDSEIVYIAILALVTSISLLGSCQISLLTSYLICTCYIFIRMFFVYQGDNDYPIRFSTYYLIALTMVFIIARVYVQRQREMFRQKLQIKQVSKLFQSLVRVYHDGILLTHDSKLVYSNKQLSQIFLN